jgi:hypothetical protein
MLAQEEKSGMVMNVKTLLKSIRLSFLGWRKVTTEHGLRWKKTVSGNTYIISLDQAYRFAKSGKFVW